MLNLLLNAVVGYPVMEINDVLQAVPVENTIHNLIGVRVTVNIQPDSALPFWIRLHNVLYRLSDVDRTVRAMVNRSSLVGPDSIPSSIERLQPGSGTWVMGIPAIHRSRIDDSKGRRISIQVGVGSCVGKGLCTTPD
jgi:hypothetical protein